MSDDQAQKLRRYVQQWRMHAETLEREVETGRCFRQSAESKLSRVQVLRSCAQEVAKVLTDE